MTDGGLAAVVAGCPKLQHLNLGDLENVSDASFRKLTSCGENQSQDVVVSMFSCSTKTTPSEPRLKDILSWGHPAQSVPPGPSKNTQN